MYSPNLKSRRALYRFVGWFFLINACLSLLIFFNYINVVPDFRLIEGVSLFGLIFAWIFLIFSFITQHVLLFYACAVCVILLVVFFPKRWLVFTFSAFFTALLILALLGDSVAFSLYHMHYANVGLKVFKGDAVSEVIVLSLSEKILMYGLIIGLFLMEFVLAHVLWRQLIIKNKGRKLGYWASAVLTIIMTMSYGLMFMANASASVHWLSERDSHLILKAARIVPYFNELYSFLMPGNHFVHRIHTREGDLLFRDVPEEEPLNYPKHSLQCEMKRKPYNIVIIGIDTWRFDSLNPEIMPKVHAFSQKTSRFLDHWSGGNCTQPGLFTLFYGIPPNYWDAVLHQNKGSLFIHQLLQNHYAMGIFASAPLTFPAFNQTIFREIKNLMIHAPGESSVARDHAVTQEFIKFLSKRDKTQPFFGFLFYDDAHNYCEAITPEMKPFQPEVDECNRFSLTNKTDPIPYVNRYRNAIYYIDQEIGKVLRTLEDRHLLENTVVIITGDHGEQINDERMGYWNHASAYNSYQLQIPLLVYWPSQGPQRYTHFTSHYDVVPTLMTRILGCQNPIADYSIGRSLFDTTSRPYLISGSYADYAIVNKEHVLRIYPGGDYEIDDTHGHIVKEQKLNRARLKKAFNDLTQYFRRERHD